MRNSETDLANWPKKFDRYECTKARPMPEYIKGQRWLHEEAKEIADYGETIRMQCPHCKHSWIEELPQ
jgi:hypothetical protein